MPTTCETTIRAVLFDLDGTLIESRMDLLLPQYFQRLSARMSHLLPPESFLHILKRATRAMVENDGRATNQAVFEAAFYPHLGHPRSVVEPIIDDFYAHDFPRLRECTTCIPEARAVMQTVCAAGFDVVIATNPLFPATAVRQRMEWAGVADFSYRLITSYENSRASKPNLRYYRHILAAIGHPAAHCLVVGDEAWDMVAAELGCPTFLVTSAATKPDVEQHAPTHRGRLAEVLGVLGVSASS